MQTAFSVTHEWIFDYSSLNPFSAQLDAAARIGPDAGGHSC
jgi:hypothetical protein